MALKCADLGHLASPQRVHRKWVHLLEEEMFRQGDLEKARGYPVSPLMDRDKGGITKSQPGVSPTDCWEVIVHREGAVAAIRVHIIPVHVHTSTRHTSNHVHTSAPAPPER